jgi:hypothetical protein
MLTLLSILIISTIIAFTAYAVKYLRVRIEYFSTHRLHVRSNYGRLSVRFNTSVELNDWLQNQELGAIPEMEAF